MAGKLARPVAGGVVTQRFGENPAVYRSLGLAGHNGIDFGVPEGTPVRAAAAGQVERASTDASGYGLHVRVRHSDGSLTLYAHLRRMACKAGQRVQAGQVIAESGNTGNSTGPHLHFEYRPASGGPAGYGGAADPLPLLEGAVVTKEPVLYRVKVLARLGVNLRSRPGKDGLIVGGAAYGATLPVLEERVVWVRVGPSAWACMEDGGEKLARREEEIRGLED
jgi:murein DD-endopeptidase MepM/ murein hydrolase activator NlpD